MMSAVPYSQEVIFLVSVLGGIILGLIWDAYRLIRHYITLGKIGIAFGDILYWIISLYVGLNIIINISWGKIRLYIFLGFVFGALVYFCVFSNLILGLLVYVIDFFIVALKKMYVFIIFPIKFFIKRLKFLLLPYKIKVDTKIKIKKREIKFYLHKYKSNLNIRKKKKLKKKKLDKLIREQKKNEKRYKNNRVAGKK